MVGNTVVDNVIQLRGASLGIEEVELSVILWSGIRVHKLVATELIKLVVMGVGSKLLEGIDPILLIDHGIVIVR